MICESGNISIGIPTFSVLASFRFVVKSSKRVSSDLIAFSFDCELVRRFSRLLSADSKPRNRVSEDSSVVS